MFELTRSAARQVRESAGRDGMEELALRVSARRRPDGGIDYRMGFDEFAEGDVVLSTAGVDVLISAPDKELLNGAVLDYVELEPGRFHFIFMNPNDPHYRPPQE